MSDLYQTPESAVQPDKPIEPISNEIRAKIKGAVIAGSIISLITIAVSGIALYTGKAVAGVDATSLIDGLVYLGLTFGIFRKSRVSAIAFFAIFLVTKIFQWVSTESFQGGLLVIVLFYYLFRGILGCFAYHRAMAEQIENYSPTATWMPWVFTPLGILLAVLITLGIFTQTGVIVPTNVLHGYEVSEEYRNELKNEGIIMEEETISLFYSEGFDSIIQGGNLLTNNRAVSYELLDSGMAIYSAEYHEIVSAELETKGDFVNDSLILVNKLDGSSFYMLAPVEESGDEVFMEMLNKRINDASQ